MTVCPPAPPLNALDQAVVVEVRNPFDPWRDLTTHEHCEGLTVWAWLRRRHGEDFDKFDVPTLCFLNGEPLMRDGWDYEMRRGDLVQFLPVVGGIVAIIIAIVVAIVAVVVTIALIPSPQVPGGTPQADPVFSRQGQYNRLRLGEPIEVGYGRRKRWPSYAARPYTSYINNDQFQYSLLCVGQGYHELEGVFIEDTPIENFQEVQYELIPPGGEVTLFPDNVVTSPAVGGIELYGPNEANYPPSGGWSGGFVVNASGTLASVIEVDLVYPSGLYWLNSGGGLGNMSVSYEFQVRLIDEVGDPLGDWTPIVEYKTFEETYQDKAEYLDYMRLVYAGLKPVPPELIAVSVYTDTRRTATPQRLTRLFDVDPGRYEVRGRRTTNKNTSTQVANLLVWQSLRAFLPSTKVYGGVTLLAVKIRASNNINDNSRSLINIISTRKLPWYDRVEGVWRGSNEEPEDLQPTRSIVLAFCDAFRATYGGTLADRFLDIDVLMELDDLYTERNEFFDWEFDQRVTLWGAAQAIARCGRATPMLTGSRVGLVRDGPKTLPVTIFNPENIVQDSFRWECKLFEFNAEDHIVMVYTDPNTWKDEEVACVLPGESQDNPKRITFSGCTDRTHAYHEGLFIAASIRYLRENIVFSTGLEGHIPTYGDLIAVQHDVPKIGFGGFVTSFVISGETTRVQLSQPVTFAEGLVHVLVLRRKDGSSAGPFGALPGATDREVILDTVLTASSYVFSDSQEPPIFLFGVTDRWSKLCKVVNLSPAADDTVEITCVRYDDRVHSFDDVAAPALGTPTLPPVTPALPAVQGLSVLSAPDSVRDILISWEPSFGAKSYVIEESYDGINWDHLATTTGTSHATAITEGDVWLRVAAINLGAGPWLVWSGTLGTPATPPPSATNLRLAEPWTDTALELAWDAMAVSGAFVLRIYNDLTDALLRTLEFPNSTLATTYTLAQAISDGLTRNLRLSLATSNSAGESTPLILVANNALPTAPTGLATGSPTGSSYPVSWTASPDADFSTFKVYASTTPGFTPGPGNLVATTASPSSTVVAAVTTYWRVSARDVWGAEETLSAEATITV